MKKLKTLLISLLAFSLLLTGCGLKGEYWKDSYTNVDTFVNAEENASYIFSDREIAYIKNETSLREGFNNNYEHLISIYEETLKTSLKPFTNLYGSMQITPNNTKEASKYFEDFNEKFDAFKDSLNNFKSKKDTFIYLIDPANYETDINQQVLREYKREFKKYISCSLDLIESYNSLYENVYYQTPTSADTITQYSFNTIKYKIASIYARAQLDYLNEYGEEYESTGLLTFNNKAKTIYNLVDNESELTLDNLNKYRDYYELLLNEYNQFVTALNNIDIVELETDQTNYYKNNPLAEVSYSKIEYFVALPALNF